MIKLGTKLVNRCSGVAYRVSGICADEGGTVLYSLRFDSDAKELCTWFSEKTIIRKYYIIKEEIQEEQKMVNMVVQTALNENDLEKWMDTIYNSFPTAEKSYVYIDGYLKGLKDFNAFGEEEYVKGVTMNHNIWLAKKGVSCE